MDVGGVPFTFTSLYLVPIISKVSKNYTRYYPRVLMNILYRTIKGCVVKGISRWLKPPPLIFEELVEQGQFSSQRNSAGNIITWGNLQPKFDVI